MGAKWEKNVYIFRFPVEIGRKTADFHARRRLFVVRRLHLSIASPVFAWKIRSFSIIFFILFTAYSKKCSFLISVFE